jgi:hypothetical protein
MTPRTLLPLIALAATAAAVPTTAALAASSTQPATPASIKVTGGYAYYDAFKPRNQREVVVVVRTAGQLPRRYDGLIRAGGRFDGRGGGSTFSVGGKASRCYSWIVPLKDGRFYPADGGTGKGPKASPGRYKVEISARDADGDAITSSKTISLRDRKPGDRSGKPLGC